MKPNLRGKSTASTSYSRELLRKSEHHAGRMYSRRLKSASFFQNASLSEESPVTIGACQSTYTDAGQCALVKDITLNIHKPYPATLTIDGSCLDTICSYNAHEMPTVCDELVSLATEVDLGRDTPEITFNQTECAFLQCLSLSNMSDPYALYKLSMLCAAATKSGILLSEPHASDAIEKTLLFMGACTAAVLCLILLKKVRPRCESRTERSTPAERARLKDPISEVDDERLGVDELDEHDMRRLERVKY